MNKTIISILKEQEKMHKRHNYACVPKETGEFLHALIKIKNPKNVLEVGTSIGYSSIWIASALQKGSKLFCIDRWSERSFIAKEFFEKSKLSIVHIDGNALDIIPNLSKKFDVVFLDATKSEYLQYLKSVKLSKRALIIADNTISHADKMKDFLAYANKNSAITLPIGSGVTLFTL